MIWQPGEQDIAEANLTHYMGWLAREKGLVFTSYADLWRWSVDHVGDFWATLWDYFDLAASHQAADALRPPALADDTMPGAVWFPGTRLNYAENIFKKMPADPAAVLIYKDETGPSITLGKQELLKKTAAVAAALRRMGVQPGDRVVAYLPNIPEAVIAMLATASLGAVWSSCPPDFGSRSVLDRFSQIEPKVLVAVDGYVYGGKYYDRRAVVAELQEALPALERTILVNRQQSTVNNKSEIRNPKFRMCYFGKMYLMPVRMTYWTFTGFPLIIHCGFFTRQAPPVCPRPLCRGMAGSRWNITRIQPFTMTWGGEIASSGTAARDG